VLRERRWLIVAVTLTFTGVAALFDSRGEELYQSTAIVETRATSQEAPLLYRARRRPEVSPGQDEADLARVILPEALRSATRTMAREHPEIPLGGLPIAGPVGPGLARIGLSSSDPVSGAVIANVLADAVVKETRRREVASIDKLIAAVRRRRRAARRVDPDQKFFQLVARENANLEIARLRVERRTAVGAAVVAPATPQTQAVFKPGQRVPPAFALGLGLALIAAFLLDALSPRTRDPRRLESAAGVPPAGLLPRFGRRDGDAALEALGRLRTAVEGLASPSPRVVALAGPGATDARLTVAVGLGEAFAATGLRACVVECEIARPVLSERLALSGPGLADVLAGDVELTSALHRASAHDGAPEITLLPAGRPGSAHGAIAPALGPLVTELAAQHDVVLLAVPPLSSGADAWELTAGVDAVLLCAGAGETPLDELAEQAELLARGEGRPVALVVTGIPRRALWGSSARKVLRARRPRRPWAASSPSLGGGG
jgi:Mrp family chromosome partitioning ATPase